MDQLTVVSLFFCSQLVTGEVYHIVTSSSDLCPVQPCLTLSQFAANYSNTSNHSDNLNSNTTTLKFQPGNHTLQVKLKLSNVSSLFMLSNSSATVTCKLSTHIYLWYISHVRIENLQFIGCGNNSVKSVGHFVLKDTTFKGDDISGAALIVGTTCLLYTSPSPRDATLSRMPSSA